MVGWGEHKLGAGTEEPAISPIVVYYQKSQNGDKSKFK